MISGFEIRLIAIQRHNKAVQAGDPEEIEWARNYIGWTEHDIGCPYCGGQHIDTAEEYLALHADSLERKGKMSKEEEECHSLALLRGYHSVSSRQVSGLPTPQAIINWEDW